MIRDLSFGDTHAMNSNTVRKGIKGDRLIEKEAEDSVLSKALGQYQLLIVSQLSILN